MSISMKSAKFEKFDQEKEFEIYNKTIQKSLDKPTEKEMIKKIADRKKHLLYEMELKEKMRNIKKNQVKQKKAEDQQRLKIGQNLFAQIMGGKPKEQDSFGPTTKLEEKSDLTSDISRIQESEELFDSVDANDIDISTGTFGGKANLEVHLNPDKKVRNVQSALHRKP